ncbi:MAG: sodium:solute symporter family protein [Planctomycetota bacterium]
MTQLIIIVIYLCLLLGLGLFASRLFRGTKKDYMLASHSIGPFLLLMSLFGTTMTAFALVGSSGEAFKEGIGVYGMLASSSGIIHSLCFFVIGVKLWSLGRKNGYTTQIQFFRDRLQSDKIGLLLFPILVGLIIPYLLVGVIAGGSVMQTMTGGAFESIFQTEDVATSGGLPPWLGSLIICSVVLIYVFFGGMRGTAWANAFQTIVFMVLGLVTFVVIANKLGSGLSLDKDRDGVTTKAEILAYEQTSAAMAMKSAESALEVARKGGKKEEIAATLTAFNKTVERTRTINDRAESRWALLSELDTNQDEQITADERPGLMDNLARASGAIAKDKSTREHLSKMKFFTYLLIPLSVGMFPHIFQHWLTAKSAGSFKLPVVAHPIFIMIVWVPCVLIGVWATTALVPPVPPLPTTPSGAVNANAVLPFLVKTQTTPILAGFLTAGILAAIMSSLDSQFLCLGTIFENDLVTHYLGKDRFSDKQQVLVTRLFIIGIVAVTYCLSLSNPRSVFTLGVWCFSGFSSLFPLVFAALYWRRLTKWGAYAGIAAAIGTWLYQFAASGYGANRSYTFDLTIGDNTYEMMPVVTIFLASLVAMVAVSLFTKPPEDEVLERFFTSKAD